MKNRKFMEALGDFVLGKGFYIVLFLCVATIGVSGYYLVRGVTVPPAAVAEGDTSLTVPDPPVITPSPAQRTPVVQPDEPPAQSVTANQPVEVPEEPKEKETPKADPAPLPAKPQPAVYTWPVKGAVLREFSVEVLSPDPTMGDWRTHGGVDISAQLEEKVLAMSAGTVTQVREDGLMGTTVVIDHGEGLTSTYCNLASEPKVKAGDSVNTGTVIGAVGDTAIAEVGLVSHLHLEVSLDGKAVDPLEYLPELA